MIVRGTGRELSRPTPRLRLYDWQVILRCTKKLLTVIRPRQLIDCTPDGEDWYADLRNINSARGYQPPVELTAQRLRATR
jgi:hypothetical protein